MTSNLEFARYAALCRALTHIIRGDLSVIVNDLSYISSVMPGLDLERAKGRATHIAQVIGQLGVLQGEVAKQRLNIQQLQLYGLHQEIVGALSDDLFEADPERIRWIFSSLSGLLSGCAGSCQISGLIDRAQSLCIVDFTGQYSKFEARSFESLCDFATQMLGERFVVDGVISDLILLAHGWRYSASIVAQIVQVRVQIPLVS